MKVLPTAPSYFTETDRVGIYQISPSLSRPPAAVVNLLDPAESDIRPNDSLAIGTEEIIAKSKVEPENRPIWSWLAWVALGVLMLEWYIYNRRTYV